MFLLIGRGNASHRETALALSSATVLVFWLWWSVSAKAESTPEIAPPKTVVVELVRAVQQNDLDGVIDTAALPEIYRGPHGREPQDLVDFLRGIDLSKVKMTGGETVADPPSKQESVILETGEDRMRVDLELRTKEWVLGNTEYSHYEVPVAPRYEIVEIHQHP